MGIETEEINRDLYRKVKKMNRKEIDELLNTFYRKGQDSVKNGHIRLEDLRSAIADVPGIGEKRLEQIMTAIQPLFQSDNESTEEEK